jgi:hypothetical protein
MSRMGSRPGPRREAGGGISSLSLVLFSTRKFELPTPTFLYALIEILPSFVLD